MNKTWITTMAAAGLLVVTGCGGGEPAAGPGEGDAASGTVQLEAGDLFFAPESASAQAGEVEISLTNTGAAEHDVVIEEAGDTEVVLAEPGDTTSGTIELEAGTYTYYCSIPGHRQAGMEGTLEVS